jgi:hypothetical protein
MKFIAFIEKKDQADVIEKILTSQQPAPHLPWVLKIKIPTI